MNSCWRIGWWYPCAFLIGIGVTGCGPSGSDLEPDVVEVLQTDGPTFHLGREIAGSWDRLCIANPYTTQERLNELLGFEWRRGAAGTGIDMLDRATLLIFTEPNRVAGYAMIPRGEGDFSTSAGNYCLSRQEAQFTVQSEENEWKKVTPLRPSIEP